MKEGIHPDYHKITVKMTNGETFETRSTYGKEGDTLQLDVDPHTHPAWTGGGAFVNKKAGKVADFNKKFGNLSMGGAKAKKAEAKPEAEEKPAKEEKQEEAKSEEAQPEVKEESTTPEEEASTEEEKPSEE